MSLDVYLYESAEHACSKCGHVDLVSSGGCVYEANITHNLGQMADEAGIYTALWRPEEMSAVFARDLIEPMQAGLALLKSDRPRFEKFNAPNGWGKYEHFVPFVERYLQACEANPNAIVKVSR